MKKVTMNGVSYIGELELKKNGKKATLSNAMLVNGGTLDRTTVSEYFKRRNIGDLETIEFGGKGTAYAISELKKEEVMLVKMAEIVMGAAKDKALESVENTLFDTFLGK